MKLTKHEKQAIERQMTIQSVRTTTWVGIRPAVMDNKKWNKKVRRAEGRKACRNWE